MKQSYDFKFLTERNDPLCMISMGGRNKSSNVFRLLVEPVVSTFLFLSCCPKNVKHLFMFLTKPCHCDYLLMFTAVCRNNSNKWETYSLRPESPENHQRQTEIFVSWWLWLQNYGTYKPSCQASHLKHLKRYLNRKTLLTINQCVYQNFLLLWNWGSYIFTEN